MDGGRAGVVFSGRFAVAGSGHNPDIVLSVVVVREALRSGHVLEYRVSVFKLQVFRDCPVSECTPCSTKARFD